MYGEFAERTKILSGLTLDQVTEIPGQMAHSIFDELWHTVLWQNIMVTRDENLYETAWQGAERYPARPPAKIEEWEALVEEFLSGLVQALDWTTTPEKLGTEVNPGETMADILSALAVHNAYHLGKIVAMRQMLGAWPA